MPEMHQAYYNWGVALAREAELLVIDTSNAKFTEIIKIYVEACEKYAEALRIKPDKLEAIQNWTVSLLKHATFLQGDDKKNKCEEAKDKALLEQKYTWKVSYNLPCAHALLDEQDEALEFLERCLVDGTLPSLAHLKADGDLESLRDTPGFDALLAKLKE